MSDSEVTRRDALRLASMAGVVLLGSRAAAQDDGGEADGGEGAAAPVDEAAALAADRARVIECGMTEAEADCWELAGRLAGGFFDLPELHVTDAHEVATAIHVIQNKLLSRPTYRKYLGRDGK
ncbi:MAG: hypothetical protein ACF8XB_13815 [Planctomycetota bacterium JB042]